MSRKVVVAGHVTLDITPVFPSSKVFSSAEEVFVPGSLITVGRAEYSGGGAVSSTGLAMKKLGMDVLLLGKTGDDEPGRILRGIFERHGAGGLIVDPAVSTSYSVVIAAPGIDRIFLHSPAANDTFTCADIPEEALEGAELFHFGYPPLMRSMYENGGEELVRIFRRVKGKGILTSLDMAHVDPNAECAKTDWPALLSRVLPYVDFFVPSLDEILSMLGPRFRDAESAAEECVRLGAKTVMIKCGTDGIWFRSADDRGRQPCLEVPYVASATGAGDTSIAAFLCAILEGRTVRESAAYAAAEGACCVMAYDTLSSLRTMPELEEIIRNGGIRNV